MGLNWTTVTVNLHEDGRALLCFFSTTHFYA